ncbi:DUF7560 family zinc ribbon protein [Halodesulfurarchaeum sp.]|uniref:DUF7560 family zinc ribbon protein n=1 Tax=Halodesulfurarchaeum sp. TaxID=1980530 RepID=UPI001BC386CF|nr:hypothetical protein [Halodesulfurarchaeum sp.]
MQAQSNETMYQFVCPQCGATPVVDDAVRRDMLDVGCYICETPVSELNFRRL